MRLSSWLRGRLFERRAAALCRREGMEVLARNVRTGSGEIDILAREGSALVIVEVRHRAPNLVAAHASIDGAKQDRLAATAREVARRFGIPRGTPVRFDAVISSEHHVGVLIRGAFRPNPPFLI